MTVGIVGGGVTGLALTHFLAERDVDVVTFEADREPGGVIRSDRVDGRLLEYGPQRVRLSPALDELVTELGLRDEVVTADGDAPLYVYADGRLREVPRSLTAFARTDLLSWRGKLRMLAEPATAPVSPDERAGEAFERKFGAEAYRNVIEPLFGGTFGSNPTEMPAEHSLSRLMSLEERRGSLLRAALERVLTGDGAPPPASFADGLQTLPEALYRAHESYVHLSTPVDVVRADGDGGYELDTGGGTTAVDTVVVTAPASAAASLLAGLPDATAAPLRELRYNSLALVHLRAPADLQGFGYQVRRDEPLRTQGVTWNAGLFDRSGVHTAFLGSAYDPEILDRPAEEIGAIARREFREVTGVEPSVLDVTKLPRAFPAYDTSWAALDDVELPEDVILAANYASRMGVPARVRRAKRLAGELADRT